MAKRGGTIVVGRDYTDDMKITLRARENPRRRGTKQHGAFALYKDGMTVGAWRKQAIAAGLVEDGWNTLHGNVEQGYITVE